MPPSPSLERLRNDVAAALAESPESLTDTENLLDRGLDSVRLMTLVEGWAEAGVQTSFLELAEEPTLSGWHSLLAPRFEEATR